jgi:hypothetical protein
MKTELYEIIKSNPKLIASVPPATEGEGWGTCGKKNQVATKCKCKIPGHVILAEGKFSLTTTEQMLVCKHIKQIKKNYVRDRACVRPLQSTMNIRPSDCDTNWADEDKYGIPVLSPDSN